MKKLLFFLLIILCGACKLFAQDKIYLRDSSIVDVKITEVSDTKIAYKLTANPNGPLYTVSLRRIYKIVYQNGIEQLVAEIPESIVSVIEQTITTEPYKLVFEPTKKNFVRLYFTDIFLHKLSGGYERILNKKYSLEIDGFYKYNTHAYTGNSKWRHSFISFYEGGELRIGGSRHFYVGQTVLSIGPSISYRQQNLSHKTFYADASYFPDIGI